MDKREWKREGEGEKKEVGEKNTDSQRKKAIKDVLRFSCVSMLQHATETEQQQPEANNATLVTLMLTTNDMFEDFTERNLLCNHTRE